MKRFITLLTFVLVAPFFVQAQDLADALRYSNFQVQGTARSGGMGNAFGALGGDFTSVSINPAGLGLYRSSELVFTPTFGQNKVESTYRNNLMTDSKYNFTFNNLSYVAALPTRNQSETGLVSVNVGIGFNRLKDFNRVANILGHDVESSFLDNLIENANGEDPYEGWRDFYEGLAYYDESRDYGADLIYEENGFWRSDIQINPFDEEKIQNYKHSQRKSISQTGAINEYSIALGLNFNHKLYVGASIGIIDVNYKESSSFVEWDKDKIIPRFNEMQFDSYLRQTGTGYNGKIGVIFKPINALRLGGSIHTPTFYNIHEYFDTYMYSNNTFEELGTVEDEGSFVNEYDFDIETPLRANLSAAYIFAKKGLISIDYEIVDYGTARLRRGGNGYNFVEENNIIQDAYKTVGNFRFGGEVLVTNSISLRGGYEFYPTALNTNINGKTRPDDGVSLNVISTGFGYRSGGFFFDATYRYSFLNDYQFMYGAPETDLYPKPEFVKFNDVKNNVMFTLGFKF